MADSNDVRMVPTFIDDNAVLYLSGSQSLTGRLALERLFQWEYGACARINHIIRDIQVSAGQIYVELWVTYQFKNGLQQSFKYIATWHKSPEDQRASRVDLEGDFSQVFQELTTVAGPPPI